jgi:hypothetical protein
MDYKSKKVKGTVMNKKFKIHETMKEDIHYHILRHGINSQKHTPGSKKAIGGSSMFMVTVHPIGGLDEKEIDILIQFILSASWIMYYGIGIEVIKKANGKIWKHMHISFVTNMMTNVKGIKAFFHGLIKENRMVSIPENYEKDTGTVENISLKIESCGSNFFDTKTPMAQCAYALKGAGIGKTRDEIKEEDYNNKTTLWTNLFDDEKGCTNEVEQQQWRLNRITFAHLLVKEIKKQKNNPPFLIHKKYHIEAAEKYAKDNDMEWTDNMTDGTHANVLATMVTATGETRYELAPGFLNTAIQDDLNCQKKKEDYKTILEETLVAHFKGVKAKAERALAKAAAGGVTTTTRDKKLARANEKLIEKNTKLENICKGHVVTIQNYKRKERGLSPLQDQTKTSTYMVSESKVGDLCCVCSKDTSKESCFQDRFIRISPCNHKYCLACIETQLDKNTIACSHCNINAIENGIRLKENWCPEFKNQLEFYRGIEYGRCEAAQRQKKRNYDDVVVSSRLLTKEEERAKRLKAIKSRAGN